MNRLEMIPSSALKKGIASAITQATSVMVAMRASQVSQPALVWMRRIGLGECAVEDVAAYYCAVY